MPPAERAKGSSLAKTYTQLLWRRHRVQSKDLQRKIQLKWAAIYALPTEEAKKQALQVNPYVPLDYRFATDTPPLFGFPGGSAEASASSSSAAAAAGAGGGEGAAVSSPAATGAGAPAADRSGASKTGASTDSAKPSGGFVKGTLRAKRRSRAGEDDDMDEFGMSGAGVGGGGVEDAGAAAPAAPAAAAPAPAAAAGGKGGAPAGKAGKKK
jgi:hypothetical protein